MNKKIMMMTDATLAVAVAFAAPKTKKGAAAAMDDDAPTTG